MTQYWSNTGAGMLCRNVIATLLVASITILRAGASEDGEQGDKSGTVLEALTVQKDNVYKTGPNDQSIYGSIAQEKTEVYESPDSSRPSSTRTRTAFAPGGPGQQGVSYVRSEEPQYQEQPNQNQKPGGRGTNLHGSYTYQSGNTYLTNPGSKNSFGSVTIQEGNRYGSRPNQQTSNNSSNSTEGEAHSQKLGKPNGQTKLSSNQFCLFFLAWIRLLKYCLS